MNAIDGLENDGRKTQVCPFLGLKDDPATALSFPSSHNCCFHARPVLPVKLEFQRIECLTGNHTSCEEFNRAPDTPLPHNLRFKGGSVLWKTIGKVRFWILILAIIFIALIAWQVLSRGLFGLGIPGYSQAETAPEFSIDAGFQTPSSSPVQAQDTPTPAPLATASPSYTIETFAPTIVSSHVLETPIGIEHKLVIHRMLAGESIVSVANQYWTTVEAIQAVNYSLPSPLQIDWLIIVPINQTNIQGLPAFDVYEVKTDIAVEILAQQLSIDPAQLKLYNGLGDGEILSSGEWVLVPHMSTATP